MIEENSYEIQRQSHIGSFEFDVESKRLKCSDEVLRLCGIKREDFSDTMDAIFKTLHPGDMENIIQICLLAISENRFTEYDYRVRATSVEEQIVHVLFAPVFNDAKKCVRILGTVQDVSTHKRQEVKSEGKEKLYHTILDASSNIIFLKDDKLRYLIANKESAEYLGKHESDIIQKTDFDLFSEEISQAHLMYEMAVITSGSSIVTEEVIGDKIFESTRFPVEMIDHKIGVGGIIRDITDHRQAELAALQERKRAEMYLDVAGVVFGALDLNENIILINSAGCKLLGYSKEELIGKSWIDNFVTESSRSNTRLVFERLLKEEVGDYLNYENTVLAADGEERIISWRIVALRNESGEITGILGSGIDITEQKEAYNALRESERIKTVLLSNLPGMAYRCRYDRDWTMQFLSEGCYLLTGYSPESFILNSSLSYNDIISDDYKEAVWNEWTRVLAIREPFRFEYEICTATGGKKWVWEMGQGVFDENGNLEALEGFVIDITDSKQKSNQIRYINDHDSLTGVYNRSYYERVKSLLDDESNLPLSIIVADINGLRLINDDVGVASGDLLIFKTAKIIQSCCGKRDILARTGGDEFSIISPNTDFEKANEMRKSIKRACTEYNASVNDKSLEINLSIGYGVKQTKEICIDDTEKEAEVYIDRQKLLDKKSHHNTILSSIMAIMYARSNETEEHATRLGQFSRMIGEKMNLTQSSMDELMLFSMLHDIGKIGIDDRILNKPGELTPTEWEIMKKHPEIGYVITMSSPEFEFVSEYVLSHHEHWDGTGYPFGLSGEEIPLLARILAVADAYDAMSEDRVYRKALPKEAAIEEIRKNAGSQFDPRIANLFVEIIR